MLAFIAEVLSHCASGIRRDKLQGCRVTGTGGDDRGVFHGAIFFKNRMDLGHRGFFLSTGDVDAVHIRIFLGYNGINGAGSFADLAVSNNQFPLSPSDWGHGVNGL